jgi:membrane protein
MLANAGRHGSGALATVIGVATILFGATGVVGQLQTSLNKIWEVEPRPGRGVLGIVRDRLFSFAMVLAIGFLLLVSLAISAALAAVDSYAASLLPGSEALLQVVNFVVALGIVTGLFALMYRYLPDVRIAWRDVWIGAAVTALLFTIGKFLIGLYLGNSTVGSTYGAAASLVILLLWVYYSSQILFLGAEFTEVYARRHGSRIEPDEDAVRVKEVKVNPDEAERLEREAPAGSRRGAARPAEREPEPVGTGSGRGRPS